MIEVPATAAGIRAVESLIAEGCNLHVTHIFSLATYEQVAQAYLRGLETFFQTYSVWRMAPVSVASVPLSVIDNEVDAALARAGRTDLREKAGVALARVLYARFRQIFSGEAWRPLRQRGGHPQRLLWIDTMPANFGYCDVHYAEALIGPDSVHALSPATLHAFRDHGAVARTLLEGLKQAQAHLDGLSAMGIDLLGVAQQLQEKTLVRDAHTYRRLAVSIAEKRDRFEEGWQRLQPTLGPRDAALSYTGLVPAALTGLDLNTLLDQAGIMACNANGCNCPLTDDNVAAQLGTIVGHLARGGNRRLTFVTSPFLADFANWAGRVVVETTAGRGGPIIPVVGEPPLNPELYEGDRLFLYIRLAGDQTHDVAVNALKSASLPVVTLHLKELYELGGLFFTWQMTMIVAAHHLGLNPFSYGRRLHFTPDGCGAVAVAGQASKR